MDAVINVIKRTALNDTKSDFTSKSPYKLMLSLVDFMIPVSPFVGIIRIRFNGYNLRS